MAVTEDFFNPLFWTATAFFGGGFVMMLLSFIPGAWW